MCNPKPGPRCAKELKKKFASLTKKLETAETEESTDKIHDELNVLREEYKMTPQGLAQLKERAEEDFVARFDYKEALARKEYLMKIVKNKKRGITITDTPSQHALSSSLSYEGEKPEWLKKEKNSFGVEPEIIDTIEMDHGEVAVVWDEKSSSKRDHTLITERGLEMNRVVFRDMDTGEERGFLTMAYSNEESQARSWGDDRWTSFKYSEEYKGKNLGMGDADISAVEKTGTSEERVALKKKIWARSHNSFNKSYGDHYPPNIKEEHAPDNEQEIDDGIDSLRGEADASYQAWKSRHVTPKVDYIKVDDMMRGKGVGHALYIYGARKLAEKGHVLQGSGIQSDSAQSAWSKMSQNDKIPVSVETDKDGDKRYVMDFRER